MALSKHTIVFEIFAAHCIVSVCKPDWDGCNKMVTGAAVVGIS